MKNKEKFAKELIELRSVAIGRETKEVIDCKSISCHTCLFNAHKCQEQYLEWLDEEYIEPRVEFEEMEIVEVKDDTEYWVLGYFKEYTEDGFVKVYQYSDKSSVWTYKHIRKVVQNGR